ncbi:hypothetical protein [Paenibacillus stellifer]|uniref:hypothetical protein n=1 Tax=Paenibacillus stellifer TaxID=169760 RepID=UPI0012EE99B1|nr:hypothetical protein [Paenibacillus stellifer]
MDEEIVVLAHVSEPFLRSSRYAGVKSTLVLRRLAPFLSSPYRIAKSPIAPDITAQPKICKNTADTQECHTATAISPPASTELPQIRKKPPRSFSYSAKWPGV